VPKNLRGRTGEMERGRSGETHVGDRHACPETQTITT